jgi:CHAT domain-containing protein
MPNGPLLRSENFSPQSLQSLQVAGLFACSSGTVRNGLPDTSNLVHQLLSGGVPTIIASRWDVSRFRTTELMAGFYGHFQSGDSPADAMLAARREVFQAHTHPYYWAALP